jgi:translation elongation factor EF-1beta
MAATAPVHHEKDVLLFEVYPEEGVTEHELETAVSELKIRNVKWMDKFQKEEIAFGTWCLKVGCVLTDAAVLSTDEIADSISSLFSKVEHHHGHHSGHAEKDGRHGHGAGAKKLVKSVRFVTFSKL